MTAALVGRLVARDKAALAGAVTLFEDVRPVSAAARGALLASLPARRPALVVGVTGPPGVGKSTLIGELAPRLVARAGLAVAVLAVDPTSSESGGALLGDRARTRFSPDEPRLFFRSQASALELGGLAPASHPVCRLLARLFDVVLVETVGVGQSETEVARLADLTIAVVQPASGDQLQFLKAGLLEVADWIVLGKAELDGAARTRAQLGGALALGRARPPQIHVVSARTGAGVDELADDLAAAVALSAASARDARAAARDAHFLARWAATEYGRRGTQALAGLGGAAALLERAGGFEAAQVELRLACEGGPGGGPPTVPPGPSD